MVLGISFIATPAKFLASSVPLGDALDIGRVTFGVMSYIESFFLLALTILLFLNRKKVTNGIWMVFWVVVVSLCINYFWLKPMLDTRVALIASGQGVQPSNLHKVYVVFESIKLIALLVGGYLSQRIYQKLL